jgi:hypothetical protein
VVQQKDARQWFAELSVDMEKVRQHHTNGLFQRGKLIVCMYIDPVALGIIEYCAVTFIPCSDSGDHPSHPKAL